jgi:hypothetical protein
MMAAIAHHAEEIDDRQGDLFTVRQRLIDEQRRQHHASQHAARVAGVVDVPEANRAHRDQAEEHRRGRRPESLRKQLIPPARKQKQ